MQISIRNLGALKKADFELSNLTIICGPNNTGKTYASYALFGFLYTTQELFEGSSYPTSVPNLRLDNNIISNDEINELIIEQRIRINLVERSSKILENRFEEFTFQLPYIFASPVHRFSNSKFRIDFRPNEFKQKLRPSVEDSSLNSIINTPLSVLKEQDSEFISISFSGKIGEFETRARRISMALDRIMQEILFNFLFPNVFISSAERTGAVIFSRDLNFPRNRLVEEMAHEEANRDKRNLLRPLPRSRRFFRTYDDYPLPVKFNVEFIRGLSALKNRSALTSYQRREILKDFKGIIGGKYETKENERIYYLPDTKEIELAMGESSSAVRSLLDIEFYLRYEVAPGDLLMIDEPELNLHPENQRKFARLLARLVRYGVKVFITTHSDYIIKELNTLIMLNNKSERLRKLAKREGYRSAEFLNPDDVSVYYTEQEGEDSYYYVLCRAEIDEKFGIEVKSFDNSIDEMNRIQEEIVWGGNEFPFGGDE